MFSIVEQSRIEGEDAEITVGIIASLRDLLVDSRIKSIGSGTPVTQSECDVEKICHLTHSSSPRLQNCQPTHVVDIVDIARVNPRTSPHNTTHARCRLPHRSVMPVTVATNNILFHWIIFARVTHPLSVISTFVDVVIVEEEIQFLYRRICPSLPLSRHLVNTAENVIDYGLCLGFQMKQTSAACFVVSPSPLLC